MAGSEMEVAPDVARDAGGPTAQPLDAVQGKTASDEGQDAGIVYELMVKMTCGACEKAVRNTLENAAGVSQVEVELDKEIVRVHSTALNGKGLVALLESAGRQAKLVGSSVTGDLASALNVPATAGPFEENVSCVAEFRGAIYGHGSVVGVVRLIQRTQALAGMEATLGGLEPGKRYSLAVHQFGDPRPGHQGPLFNGSGAKPAASVTENVGYLGAGEANADGQLEVNNGALGIHVWEIIGRGLGVHAGEPDGAPLASSIVARSAVVGANHKKVCTCDGTLIWEANE